MSRSDDIIELIDGGLQSSSEDSYGDLADLSTCSRCEEREPAAASDFCPECRAFLLGDGPDPVASPLLRYNHWRATHEISAAGYSRAGAERVFDDQLDAARFAWAPHAVVRVSPLAALRITPDALTSLHSGHATTFSFAPDGNLDLIPGHAPFPCDCGHNRQAHGPRGCNVLVSAVADGDRRAPRGGLAWVEVERCPCAGFHDAPVYLWSTGVGALPPRLGDVTWAPVPSAVDATGRTDTMIDGRWVTTSYLPTADPLYAAINREAAYWHVRQLRDRVVFQQLLPVASALFKALTDVLLRMAPAITDLLARFSAWVTDAFSWLLLDLSPEVPDARPAHRRDPGAAPYLGPGRRPALPQHGPAPARARVVLRPGRGSGVTRLPQRGPLG